MGERKEQGHQSVRGLVTLGFGKREIHLQFIAYSYLDTCSTFRL